MKWVCSVQNYGPSSYLYDLATKTYYTRLSREEMKKRGKGKVIGANTK